MATSINIRLSDELEEKLKKTVEEVKDQTPLGAEVNNSTVVRGALEDFIKKIEEEKEGIKNVSYNLSAIDNEKELEKFDKLLECMFEVIKENNSLETGVSEKILLSILTKIKLHTLKHKMKFI